MPKKPKKPTTSPSPVQNSEEEPATEPLALELIDDDRPAAGSFPVVGVGASAGGLEAFTQLLHALPPDTGMAFVFIQHLDPKHVSMLRQLLSRETSMGVSEAVHQSLVEPNHVYVIPQNTCMSIRSNRLLLEPRSGRHHMPVNYFLQSLAVDMKSRAIGVILSGTGSDGTVGLKAVKAGGGISFAQEPVWAKFPGMPRSAIAARCVDFILPPDGIAKELAQLGKHPYVHQPELVEAEPTHGNAISRILAQLRIGAGVDFTRYKTSTIRRRIARRMVVHKLERPEHYADLLRTNPAELTELYEDILINVTEFFRDPETFKALQRDIFPQILAHQEVQVPIRIWVPGCSTGEEVYSIAIALMEHLGPNAEHVSAQIFGTDISDMALDTARSGIYSEAIVQNVSGERLRRFFTKLNPGYRINKRIREMCIFAKQNVAKDPPFSRLHLISCRNVLIYLDSFLQKRIIPSFHYALQPSGFLLLGASESIGVYAELFSQVDKKHKIYLQKPHSSRPSLEFHVSEPAPAATPRRASVEWTEMDVREADKILLAKYAPPGVVIDEHLNILQFRGPVSPFLQPAGGPASLNLMRMAPDEIQREVRNAMHRAQAENRPVRREVLKLRQNGKSIREIGLEVIPFKTAHTGEPRFLIVFEETPRKVVPLVEAAPRKRKGKALSLEVERENQHLRQEIAANKDYLQSIIDAQEASNEELRSASEEIQSTNEELQSTNEELETAKEEMQSTNEELYTVNEELENRNLQLSQAGNDLVNLLNNILIPIVMLGSDLRIRRFTPVCEKVLNLIPSDIGRPINDIKFKLEVPDIEQLLLEVLQTLEPRVKEVRDLRGHPYSMRLRPYRTEDNRIDGVVLALIDMDPGGTVAQEQVAADPRWQSGQNRLAALLDGDDKLRGNKESIRSLATGLLQAQEDERRRISRELHDDLNQKLALLHVNVERMEAKAPRGAASIRSNLKLFREAVSDLSDSIRRIAYHLHPSMLDDLGLVAAAQSFCEDFSESENIQVTFQHENIPGSVPQDVSLCVYRILQEALRNIAKHAHSKRAMVALEGDASFLRLTVKDAGTGFNRDDLKRRHGLGLLGMQERVRLVGGQLSIDSHPGEGTRVEVEVPLGQAPQIGPAAMTNEENVS